ncbi:aminoglycoside phosphotransferase family protein [Amycolatopsis minnesotensis]|uniref:Aminoglycoside phosphotransferase family protein n=1 Tax=Amycolatopsis minnesotensis TaxID=337894 RepID=A0ABN2RJZ3_9PSEU
MPTPPIPAAFIEEITEREGDEGRAWLAQLPAAVEHCFEQWKLRPDGEPMHGYTAVVYPTVGVDGTPSALKLPWQDDETRDERLALSTWDGAGSVLLLDHDETGALLLERLDQARSLDGEPIGSAVEIAGGLLRRLAVAAPPLSRSLAAEAERWAADLPELWRELAEPLPRRMLDAALDACRNLGPEAGALLVNEDSHYLNVLAGTREPWLVIDPKPLTGDVEFGVIPLLWNRFTESTLDERFAGVVSAAGLDRDRALAWTLVRAVENWLGLTEDEDDDFPYPEVIRIAEWAVSQV